MTDDAHETVKVFNHFIHKTEAVLKVETQT